MSDRSAVAGMLLLTAATLVGFLPMVGGGWMSDDFVHLHYLQTQHFSHVFGSPDAFGYYRPVSQATLLANLRLGGSAMSFRLTNLLLHVTVIVAAFILARLVIGRNLDALLAAIAFALTPKAAQIAVLWASARPELLMSLFALLAVASWIRWSRGGGYGWWAAALACYVAALLSKETAILLPLLLALTPSTRPMANRAAAAAFFVPCAVAALVLRTHVGARTPFADANYVLIAPGADIANAWNYLTRAIPSPAALLLAVALASRSPRRDDWISPARTPRLSTLFAYACLWLLVFILPVLPLPSRSELYLYFSGFGFCLFAGAAGGAMVDGRATRGTRAVILAYVVALGGYQMLFAARTHEVLDFSAKLVRALQQDDAVKRHVGMLVLVPADRDAERLLHGSIGGYLDIVVKVAGRPDLQAAVVYDGGATPARGLHVTCGYRNREVMLTTHP